MLFIVYAAGGASAAPASAPPASAAAAISAGASAVCAPISSPMDPGVTPTDLNSPDALALLSLPPFSSRH